MIGVLKYSVGRLEWVWVWVGMAWYHWCWCIDWETQELGIAQEASVMSRKEENIDTIINFNSMMKDNLQHLSPFSNISLTSC